MLIMVPLAKFQMNEQRYHRRGSCLGRSEAPAFAREMVNSARAGSETEC